MNTSFKKINFIVMHIHMYVLHLALEFYYSYYDLSSVLTYYKGLIKGSL